MNVRRWAALLLCLTLMQGCWNRREVNEVAIVSAVGIDRESEGVLRVTLQIANPLRAGGDQGGVGSRLGTFTVTATGRTLFEAIRSLNLTLSRKPEWTHNNAIILSEEVARGGVGGVLDFFLRDHESRLDQWLLVTRGKAADVFVPNFQLEANQGVGIRRLNRNAFMETAKTAQIRLYDFLLRLSSPPTAPMAAGVEPVPPAGGQPGAPEPDTRLGMHGAAVFEGDKMAGWLTDTQTRGVAWMRERISSTIVVVPCRKPQDAAVGIEVLTARSELRPEWRSGPLPVVRAVVRVSAKLGDAMCSEDFTKAAALDDLESRTAAVIRREIIDTMSHLQHDLGTDPVGIGVALQRAFPRQWRTWKSRWTEIYPKITVSPEVSVELHQTGTATGKPLQGGGGP